MQQGLIITSRATVFVLVMCVKHLIISMENVQAAIKDLVLQMEPVLRVLTKVNVQKKMR